MLIVESVFSFRIIYYYLLKILKSLGTRNGIIDIKKAIRRRSNHSNVPITIFPITQIEAIKKTIYQIILTHFIFVYKNQFFHSKSELIFLLQSIIVDIETIKSRIIKLNVGIHPSLLIIPFLNPSTIPAYIRFRATNVNRQAIILRMW